jgi:hypothetical protein
MVSVLEGGPIVARYEVPKNTRNRTLSQRDD